MSSAVDERLPYPDYRYWNDAVPSSLPVTGKIQTDSKWCNVYFMLISIFPYLFVHQIHIYTTENAAESDFFVETAPATDTNIN